MTAPGFWHASLANGHPRRPALSGRENADVCIVGGGFTGLWTAWWLKQAEPSLEVCVVEQEEVGFGASGRNGGWLSGFMPGDREVMSRTPSGRDGVVAFQRALIEAVGEVEGICESEGIDADVLHGGTLVVATNAAQMRRLAGSVERDREWGITEADLRLLDAAELSSRVRVDGALGGAFSPHCARVQPAKLVKGLARSVEARGVRVFEDSRVLDLRAGSVSCPAGEVHSPWVVQATEAYTAGLRGQRRRLLPMSSSIVVTEPLDDGVWSHIGWAGYETLRDGAHEYVYLQRTADGRIAIGGRGNPYRYASRDASGRTPNRTVASLVGMATRMFPALSDARFDLAWSGILGVARDWCPFVDVERTDRGGIARAGGYVGDGVTTSYLAGRTMADIVLGRATALTALPWVGHRGRSWEPEPLRWLGVHALFRAYEWADRAEAARPSDPRTSRWALAADWVGGPE